MKTITVLQVKLVFYPEFLRILSFLILSDFKSAIKAIEIDILSFKEKIIDIICLLSVKSIPEEYAKIVLLDETIKRLEVLKMRLLALVN